MKSFKNQDIRKDCKESGVYIWQICEKIGICEMTMSRKLRKELSQEEKDQIRTIISELKAGE